MISSTGRSSASRGAFVAFCGLDGAGKSTQIDLLANAWAAAGIEARRFWSRPGYTGGVNRVKALLRRCGARAVPPPGPSDRRSRALARPFVRRLWLTAALLDLAFLYAVWITWQRRRGRSVVCDRYLCDALVDLRLRFPDDGVERWWLWRFIIRSAARPDVQFLMLVPVEEALRRSTAKQEPFPDSPEELYRRLHEYLMLSRSDGLLVLDGRKSASDLHLEVLQAFSRATGAGANLPPRERRQA